MNERDLFNAIGEISDDLITEADNPAKKLRRIKISKIAVIAAVFLILFSLTVFASRIISRSSSSRSSAFPDYYTVPSQHTLQKDVGISPRVIKSFSNGYVFQSGSIVENEDYDMDGSIFEKYKSLSCRYTRAADALSLYIDNSAAGNQMENRETAAAYKNSKIKYFSYENKFVPANYQLTEQDKKDQESGKYVFSYGTDEVELYEVQIAGWEYNGLNYTICAMNSSVTKEELVKMAKEIIDYQK